MDMSLEYTGVQMTIMTQKGEVLGKGFVDADTPDLDAKQHIELALDRAMGKFKASERFKEFEKDMMVTMNLKIEMLIHTGMPR
jgi:hypothetical protein